jgi:hypothetical protein
VGEGSGEQAEGVAEADGPAVGVGDGEGGVGDVGEGDGTVGDALGVADGLGLAPEPRYAIFT